MIVAPFPLGTRTASVIVLVASRVVCMALESLKFSALWEANSGALHEVCVGDARPNSEEMAAVNQDLLDTI